METIGGQAVIEGIMLRKKNQYVVAVRDPKNKIIVTKHRIKDYRKGFLSLFKYPVFRGMYAMYEMLDIGIRTLIYSSNISLDESEEKITKKEVFWLVTTSVLIALGFFVVLPYVLTVLIGVKEEMNPVLFNIIDAIIKTVLFVLYVYAISQLKDIKRMFQYHGAEHKAVNCFEAKKKLTLENIKKFTTLHPRCGSSFIMLVIVVSIIIFSFIPLIIFSLFPQLIAMNIFGQKAILLVIRLLAIPVIAGTSYEILKLAGKYPKNPVLGAISWPGLALQKLTTAEPDPKQIEVAVRAVKKLIN